MQLLATSFGTGGAHARGRHRRGRSFGRIGAAIVVVPAAVARAGRGAVVGLGPRPRVHVSRGAGGGAVGDRAAVRLRGHDGVHGPRVSDALVEGQREGEVVPVVRGGRD